MYQPGPLIWIIHSVVSNDFVNAHTVWMRKLIWTLAVRICPKTFSNDAAHLMMNTVRRCPTDTRKAENGIGKQKIASRVKAGIIFSDEIMFVSTAFRIFFAF